ncbi:hypothetical protein FF2_013275 [Malus domestica]
MKWALELSLYGLVYRPHTTIKAQVLVDFITEYTLGLEDATTQPKDVIEHALAEPTLFYKDFWSLHIDGSSNYKGSRAGLVLITLEGPMLEKAITLGFKASNNEAEYEDLLASL